MSRMHNPAHPGEVLREWLPEDMTVTEAAKELLMDWYHHVGFMCGDIEQKIGTEPMSINWRHWLSLPSWKKQQAVLLVCGLEPNEFYQVENHKDYKGMCKPFIELFDRTTEESNTPFDWLNKFKGDGYLGCVPRGVDEWLTQQIEQAQLKQQTDVAQVEKPDEQKPWLIADPSDPSPKYVWYTPARYFARQLVIESPILLTRRNLLAGKVAGSLYALGFTNRSKKKYDSGTVLKAFANVTLG